MGHIPIQQINVYIRVWVFFMDVVSSTNYYIFILYIHALETMFILIIILISVWHTNYVLDSWELGGFQNNYVRSLLFRVY